MKIAILSANLGNFDTSIPPVKQNTGHQVSYHQYTDKDFPPITGLTPRLQYRIPKLFGWDMYPGYDVYIWMDGGISFKRDDSVSWYLEKMGENHAFFFAHPWRHTIKEEVDHIEKYLQKGSKYIVPRYKNGLHKEIYAEILKDKEYKDDFLLASTIFVYRNNEKMRKFMKDWWYWQSRYYTVDQIAQTYLAGKIKDNIHIERVNLFEIGHVSLVSHHNTGK